MKSHTCFVTLLLAVVASSSAFVPSSSVIIGSANGRNTNDGVVHSALSMTTAKTTSTAASPSKNNAVMKLAANGMSLLKPIFAAEAYLQAAILGAIGNVDKDAIVSEIDALKKENNVLIYTYGLSPFSTEALSILDAYGCDYKKVELGLEWFLLGGNESEIRVALSREVESGATSLPKIFIGGECIGGYAELANLAESGELDEKLKKATKKQGASKNNGMPNPFAGFFQ